MKKEIHQFVVRCLKGSDLDEVQTETGIPRSTLYKIMEGYIPNPGIKSIEPLYFHFLASEGRLLRKRAA